MSLSPSDPTSVQSSLASNYNYNEINNSYNEEEASQVCTKTNYNRGENMTELNAECIITQGRTLDKLPSSETPYAIIKYGPTGSGKGSEAVRREIELLGVPINDYAVFEIDSLVESVKQYRNKTLNIRNKQRLNKTNHPSIQMYKNLFAAYANTRKHLSGKLDATLEKALKTKKNFIFETTGQFFSGKNPIGWLIDNIKEMGKDAYKIVFIYPLVSPTELSKRVTLRAEVQASRKNKPLFRAINTSTLEPSTAYAKQNLTHFILPEIFVKNIYKVVILWNE